MRNKNRYALDLGSSKFCIAFLHAKGKKSEIEIYTSPSKGMKNGILTDFSIAKDQLSILIEKAEHKFNTDIDQVTVGISGSKTTSQLAESYLQLENGQIDKKIILSLYKQAIEKTSSCEKITLHACPLGFQINNDTWYENPLGMRAKTIKARYFILQADGNYAKEIIRLCNKSGLKVEHVYAASFASSASFLSHTLKKMGVVLVDIGGASTTGIIYIQEKPVESFSIPIGSDSLTQDLSIGFSISQEEAEKIKRLWGAELDNQSEILEVLDIHEKKKIITKEKNLQIILPRIQEISTFIDKKISKYKNQIGAGLLLTGGGAEVTGIEKICNHVLKIPCNLLKPLALENLKIAQDPYPHAFSGVVGMLLLEEKDKKEMEDSSPKHSLTSWFFSLFLRQ